MTLWTIRKFEESVNKTVSNKAPTAGLAQATEAASDGGCPRFPLRNQQSTGSSPLKFKGHGS